MPVMSAPRARLLVKPSQRCTYDALLLADSRDAYIDLLNSGRAGEDGRLSRVVVPAVKQRDWQRKRQHVAMAAGAVGDGASRYGETCTLRNAAYVMHDVDPILN